jgi:hypothetical protein
MKKLCLVLLLGLSLVSYAQDDNDSGNTQAAPSAPANPSLGANKPIGNDAGVPQYPTN